MSFPPRNARRRPGRGVRALLVAIALCGWAAALPAPARASVRPEGPPSVADGPGGPIEAEAKARAGALAQSRAIQQPETVNQDAWDARYYSLDIAIDPATTSIVSTVRALATVTNGPLTTLELDLRNSGLTVDGVTCAGNPTTFTHAADLLTIQLDRAYVTGETIDVTVNYHGTPDDGGFGYFTFMTRYNQPLVASLSEPFGAHYWWPCKDQNSDKPDSVDVRVTAPTGMKTASNGTLVSATDDGIHSVWQWHERHPIAPYLVSLASYPYDLHSDYYHSSPTDSMEIKFFIFPPDVGGTNPVNAMVKNMIAAESARFGPYPFLDEKYGHAEFAFGGGMEHQTCTSLGAFGQYVVAHELGHQWWGDHVTCNDFHHIWLNEGFATYSEAVWAEANGGASAYHTYINGYQYFGAGTVYVPDVSDVNRIFQFSTTYEKGSWVLHMLRHVLGDSTFFAALRDYGTQYGYASATTENFQTVMENAYGGSLQKFFQEWIYGEYTPQYRVTYASTPSGGGYDVVVWVTQTQSNQVFWMPVDLTVNTANTHNTYVVGDSLAFQQFAFHTTEAPVSVQLDKDVWILRGVTYPTAVPAATAPGLELLAPTPNPTAGATDIAYTLPRAAVAEAWVMDAAGRRVAGLARGPQAAGLHRVRWDTRASRAGAGVYWVVLESDGARQVRRLAVVR